MGSLRLLLSLETRCARVRVHWPLPNLLVLRILVPSRPKLSDPENTRLNAIEGTSGERAARPGPRLERRSGSRTLECATPECFEVPCFVIAGTHIAWNMVRVAVGAVSGVSCTSHARVAREH